jgi:hypothetical protein
MGKEGLPHKFQKEMAKEKLNQITAYDVPSKANTQIIGYNIS